MKIAGLMLPLLLAANSATLGADEPAKPVAPAPAIAKPQLISPELSQQLSSILPKYAPPAPMVEPAPPDPEVLVLPTVIVTHKKRPRLKLTDEVMMTPKGFNEQLAKTNLSSLDRNFLNKFTLPAWLSGQSAADRAREEYDRQQKVQLKSDVEHLAKAAEVIDPAQAKAMRDAVNRP